MNRKQAEISVIAVFADLSTRGGIGDVLDQIMDDPEVYNEMFHSCVDAILIHESEPLSDEEIARFAPPYKT